MFDPKKKYVSFDFEAGQFLNFLNKLIKKNAHAEN